MYVLCDMETYGCTCDLYLTTTCSYTHSWISHKLIAIFLYRHTHRYIEVFRSTHAEIRPVRGALPPGRPTPYDRPGARGGYGGYSSKYGSGYERSYRGRGRGGGPVPAGYPPYDPYGAGGGAGGYYEQQDYYGGGFDGGFHPPPPGAADQSLVSYPPIRPSQPTRGGFGAPKEKHSIRMRGLPFSAKDKDITDFFTPLVPLKVNIDFDHYGRPSGEAEVQFSSHEDAMAAMQKNNDHMGKLCTVCWGVYTHSVGLATE